MKRLFTILMIVAAIFTGFDNADAKTTKRSGKAKTTHSHKESSSTGDLGIFMFCNKGDRYRGPSGKNVEEIISGLEKNGFKSSSTYDSSFGEYDEWEDKEIQMPSTVMVYEKEGILISIYVRVYDNKRIMDNWPYQIEIMFSQRKLESRFISNLTASGFKKTKGELEIYYNSLKEPSGVSVQQTVGADEMFIIRFFDAH